MTNRKKKVNLNVYKKVILVFTALIIPVYLVNLWMNYIGLNYIKQQDMESNSQNLKFYASQLNDQVYFIRNLQLQMLNDSDLHKLGFMADVLAPFEKRQLVNSVFERLVMIQSSSEYLLNAGVYIKNYNKTISTKNGSSDMPNEESDLILSVKENKVKHSFYFMDGRLFFIEFSNRSSVASYLELSVPKLRETLNHLVKHESSGAILTNDQFSGWISNQYNEEIINAIQKSKQGADVKEISGSFVTQSAGGSYQILSHRIPSLGWTIYTYSDQNVVTGQIQKYNVWFIVLSIISLVVIFIFSISINRMIHRPLHKLIRAFRMMERDHRLTARWNEVSEFDYLYQGFDSMMETLNKSIRETYEHKLALQHSELKQLQSQINPHFLYNSFYNIYRLCKIGDYENVSLLTQKLASYYQFITRSGTDEVTLDKEYRHAEAYCEIQSIRFANRIQMEMPELPEKCKPLLVPRLIIQPLIENAYEHAFENSAKPGRIVASIQWDGEKLSFRVEDDGEGMTDEQLSELQSLLNNPSLAQEKTGLINVSSRIRLRYGERSGVFVSKSKYGGVCAEIVLEHHTGGDSHA